MSVELFKTPISVSLPPNRYPVINHSQPPVGCNFQGPIQTNNTFNNLLLADQTFPVWTLPYSLWITKDGNQDWGMAFNHTDAGQLVFGPDPAKTPAQFYFNPPKIKLFTFTGKYWAKLDVKILLSAKLLSTVKLSAGGSGVITIPLVYGMGFVTGIYKNEIPVLSSAVGVQEFKKIGNVTNGVVKYTAKLFNQVTWSIYVSVDTGNELRLEDPNHIAASQPTSRMVIQVARGEDMAYDVTAGKYQTGATISGSVDANNKSGNYSFGFKTEGQSSSGYGLVWALPHHQSTLSSETNRCATSLVLCSPTKGKMKAYVSDKLDFDVPNLPIDIAFEPATTVQGYGYAGSNYTDSVKQLIREAAQKESQQDVAGQCDLDSMYFGGKQLDKYAYIAYVTHFILRDSDLTQQILPKVKKAIEKYASNNQKLPLAYDQTWKGLISSAPPDQDFGNSNYNDHHFHYGYHVHAIALIARIDPKWLSENNNLILDYVTTLIRDYANPSDQDPFFPQYRNFDWFHGHSFAHGIFPSGDGKNEESSSEDYHAYYGVKLFAKVIGDLKLEQSANLILGIMRTSLNLYMLFTDDNPTQPAQFKGNKVSGILFENKVDFATFFGRGTVGDEFIHGIHMLPITPISSYIRGAKYAEEEWDAKLAGIVDRIPDGWRGILMLNAGLFDPKRSWQWFSRGDWQNNLIDGGMSRTWSLAYLAGIGGAK